MIDVKRFGGVLNNDDAEQDLLPIQHFDCLNGRFYGGQKGLTFQNVKGNYLVANSSLPAGTNECIGAVYDSVNHRIIWFNYNSYGNNGIYQLLIQTGAVSKIFLCNTDSASDILNFSLDHPVHSVSIVYRTVGDGDLLYWTDGYNRPRYLNLSTVATLQPFTEDMINAAKIPPLRPPETVTYNSDATFNANQVKNKYFQFSYRWVYTSLEKSTFSPFSIVPIPENIVSPNADISTNTNNCIDLLVYSAATADFKAIEIISRTWLGSTWSDWFLIQTVTTDDIATPLPFAYTFRFYNNGTYSPIATDDTDLYFDWLPDKANTLELLNGNVIIYAGITEGYEPLTRQDVDVQITSSLIGSTTYPAVSSAWKWGQYQRFGIQYFDKRGKPIGGVVSFLKDTNIDTTNFDVTTPQFSSFSAGLSDYPVPKIFSTINHLPPADAESYAWVRQDLIPPFFLQWLTNDYQLDSEYLYLGIQTLIEANTKTGFVPSYEFTAGDRVRIYGIYIGVDRASGYVPQLDFQILEVVQKTMSNGNPASNGAFLKVKRPSVFPIPSYLPNMLIEMYTPPAGISTVTTPFYEWGQRYGFQTILGVKYHLGGTQNQTAVLPALTEWINGDVYVKQRVTYTTIGVNTALMMMDRRYNDFQDSAVNSNGRVWVLDPNAKEAYNGTLLRWGGKYQQGTNINNLNRFRPTDFDEIDRAKGDIQRLKTRDRILRVFQDRGVGQFGVYTRFIQNNAGVPELVTTNEIITSNNINYYQGAYGLGGYPTNLCSSAQADYFNDVVTGREVRLSGDGITDLGLLYKGQFTLASLVTPYNKEVLRSDGKIAKVMKFWDSFENQAHTVLQAGVATPDHPDGLLIIAYSGAISAVSWKVAFFGYAIAGDQAIIVATSGATTETFTYTCADGDSSTVIRNALITLINASALFGATSSTYGIFPAITMGASTNPLTVVASINYYNSTTVTDQNYSFNETRNAFCSYYSFHPEWALSADDVVYSWKNGQIYKHAVSGSNYCTFYGEVFDAYITVVFNPNILEKKSWHSITEIASDTWDCPVIYGNVLSYSGQRQQTSLVPAEFVKLEENPSASIKRDAFSRGGKINGDAMKGNWLVIKFQKENAINLINLSELSVSFADSPLTNR